MTPYYLLDERLLRQNLSLIQEIATASGAEFILAFKAYALWKTFPIFRQYIRSTTASSHYEARLAFEEFGAKAHTYSPAYEEDTFGEILRCSSHITFNSLSQYERFRRKIAACSKDAPQIGLRINPEYSEIQTALYNPCASGSRFGVLSSSLPAELPADIAGFHLHCHCESDALALVHTLEHVEEKFRPWLSQIRWLNLGGGHLVTRKGYDVQLLVQTLREVQAHYPNLHLILEPGSAFAWETGTLHAEVVDLVENQGVHTAILNVSFTCHMPDCLEMPYYPKVRGAAIKSEATEAQRRQLPYTYRLGGNSCLSGDYMGDWLFEKPLSVGDELIFEDMIHYTTVKTNMFNGISHPDIRIQHLDGTVETLRSYTYEDYRSRMD